MIDIIRRPERRIEDIQTILKGKERIEGTSKFGNSTISTFHNDYVIDVASSKSGMRIFLVVDGSGKFKYSGRYFDREPGSEPKPLSPAEITVLKEPIIAEDRMIDEVIATFQEGAGIKPHDKDTAIGEESEKIAKAVRDKIVSITNLTADFCKSKSSDLQTKKLEIAPSVVNSFADEDWKIVIEEVRQRIQPEELSSKRHKIN